MTTSTEKAHLGIAALYAQFSSGAYSPESHWSRCDTFVQNPLLLAQFTGYAPSVALISTRHDYVPDAWINTRTK
jgi:hypothetical protein